MTIDKKIINYSDLQGILIGKENDYNCINLTEYKSINSKIIFQNAIMATTILKPEKFIEEVDFLAYFTDYNDFLKTEKMNGCFHVKIFPLTEKDILKLDTIKSDLEIK